MAVSCCMWSVGLLVPLTCKYATSMSIIHYITMELSQLLCLITMITLRQPKQLTTFNEPCRCCKCRVGEDSCSNGMEPSDLIAGKRFYTMYTRSVNILSLSPLFKLESLPPTATAAKFNSHRAYRTLQQWSVTICL